MYYIDAMELKTEQVCYLKLLQSQKVCFFHLMLKITYFFSCNFIFFSHMMLVKKVLPYRNLFEKKKNRKSCNGFFKGSKNFGHTKKLVIIEFCQIKKYKSSKKNEFFSFFFF